MSNQEAPFASFVPSGEPPAEPAGKTRRGKRKGKDKSTRPKEAAAAPKVWKTRKPRVAGIMKIGIGAAIIALAGLSADDVELLKSAAAVLVDKPKKQRQRVAVALAKIFA